MTKHYLGSGGGKKKSVQAEGTVGAKVQKGPIPLWRPGCAPESWAWGLRDSKLLI